MIPCSGIVRKVSQAFDSEGRAVSASGNSCHCLPMGFQLRFFLVLQAWQRALLHGVLSSYIMLTLGLYKVNERGLLGAIEAVGFVFCLPF